MDWFDLLAVQGTLKGLLQNNSSKESVLRCSAFFRVQLLYPYTTTGKTIALTSVQSLSHVRLFETPWTAEHQASLSITDSQSLLKLMSIKSVMPSSHLILCHPLLLLPSIFPSISVFSNESALRIRWPKYLSFSFNISPSNEHSGLISFRVDWLDLLAVQVTLKSLPQHYSSKASILQCSAFLLGSISRSGRSPGEGNGNPFQYSCLENPWTEEPGRLNYMESHGS